MCRAHSRGDDLRYGGVHSIFFPSTKLNKPWFNSACSRAIRRRDAALRSYRRLQTAEPLANFISPRNRTKNIFFTTRKSHFSVENVTIFLVLHYLVLSGISKKMSTKTFAPSSYFPPQIFTNGSLLFSLLLKLNSLLKFLFLTQH